MKIYFATKWENREEARQWMAQLTRMGHTITYDWTAQEQESGAQAHADIVGVLQADCLVLLAHQDVPYVGALIEVGVALGAGKHVYVVGDAPVTRTMFFKHPLVRRGITRLVEEF